MEQLFVSVIIPNFNHAPFLDERIRSILNQTYQNFELIILDDCSTDDGASQAVIETYRSNPHVSHIVYNDVNSGSTFKQWQKGFDLAKGELIWIAESDDSCSPSFLETVVQPFEKDSQCVLSFSRSMRMDGQGTIKDVYGTQKYMNASFLIDGKRFIDRYLKKQNIVVNASSAVFRKRILSGIDPHYMTLRGCGDWLFWIHLAECGKVSYAPEKLNYYRYHSDNTTSHKDADGTNDREMLEIFNYLHAGHYYSRWEFLAMKTSRYLWRLRELPFSSREDRKRFLTTWNLSGLELAMGRLLLFCTNIKEGIAHRIRLR